MDTTIYTTHSSMVCVDENGKLVWQMGVDEVAVMRSANARLTEENRVLREALEPVMRYAMAAYDHQAITSIGLSSGEIKRIVDAAALVKGEA